MRRGLLAAIAVAVVGLSSALPGSAATTAAKFSAPIRLGPWIGFEPSIAFDPSGNGAVYVVAPQGGPSGAVIPINALDTVGRATETFEFEPGQTKTGENGVGFWASYDGGRSWRLNKNIGTGTGGWDADVVVGKDHTVYVADLEVLNASICSSTNAGRDFTSIGLPAGDTCQAIGLNAQGPSNDRQWLNVGRDGELYLTYHELATGFPIMLKSNDKAKTFTPCGSLIDPQSDAGKNYSPVQGTLVARPVIGKDRSIYVTVTEPDGLATSPVGSALNHLFVSVAPGGCDTTTVWKNYKIYENPGASFTLFNSLAIDGAGYLYAVATGKTKSGQTADSTWLFVSKDKGVHWSAPMKVNTSTIRGNVMPAVVGGLRGGQVAIGWFGTKSSGDPNNLTNQWRFYLATSFDAGRHFYTSTVTPGVIHYGAICTQGTLCDPSSNEGNRNLADFASLALNPRTGCVVAAFPGDPWNRPDLDSGNALLADHNDFSSSAYVASQTGGTCLR